jgi:hypothetical protein
LRENKLFLRQIRQNLSRISWRNRDFFAALRRNWRRPSAL